MRKKWLYLVAVGLLLVTGCNGGEQEANGVTAEQLSYGLLGPGPANYGMIRKQTTYNHPSQINHSTSWRTLHGERRTLGDDEQLIHQIINDKHGLEMGMVLLVGKDAYVNVTLPADLEAKEKKEKLDRVREDLREEIPRINVHVSEKDNEN